MRKIDLKNILDDINKELFANENLFKDPSVEYGKMGLAIFYCYCHQFYQENFFLNKAKKMINDSILLLNEISKRKEYQSNYYGDSFSNIISSFGKGLLFIQFKLGYKYEFSEYQGAISNILIDITRENIRKGDFDFFSGALSGGHYFLNSYTYTLDQDAKNILLEIYNGLRKNAIHNTVDEIYWKAPTYGGSIYLGLSHGSAMVINFLNKLFEREILCEDDKEGKTILEKAVNFVLNRKRNVKNGFFPHVAFLNEMEKETIFAMCYGDLGILYALHNSKVILSNTDLKIDIEEMSRDLILRKKDQRYTRDAGLFYGASGVFCLFKELHKKTNNEEYKIVSNYWYNQITSYRNLADSTCYVGFSSKLYSRAKEIDRNMFSFGWGLIGIGTCLILGSDEKFPSINELLLIGI